MTELEALAKDCIENHTHRLVDKPTKQDIYLRDESIFIQGYRQSEKRIADLEKENAKLKTDYEVLSCSVGDFGELQDKLEEEQRKNNGLSDKLTKAKEIMNIAIEGIKYWGIVGGTERPFEKQSEKLFNLFLEKAEQFLKELEK